MDKYRVTPTAEGRVGLQQMASTGMAAARKLTHARILRLADTHGESLSGEEIVTAPGASFRTVARVRQCLVTRSLPAALDRKAKPPRPDRIKIKGGLGKKLIEVACSDPPRGRCHRTLQLPADEMVVPGLVDTVSTETVPEARKETTSSPGSSKHGSSRPGPTPGTSGGPRT